MGIGGMIIRKPGVLLLGGLIGAGTAMLLAPTRGREARKRIAEFADDARYGTRRYIKKAKRKIILGGLRILL